jgi:hypothetical protein
MKKKGKRGTSNIFSQIKWHSRTKRLATVGVIHDQGTTRYYCSKKWLNCLKSNIFDRSFSKPNGFEAVDRVLKVVPTIFPKVVVPWICFIKSKISGCEDHIV